MKCDCGEHRSRFECKLAHGVLRKALYEKYRLEYDITSRHVYTPDFIFTKNSITYYCESKGYFRDRKECNKYKFIWKAIKNLPGRNQFIFVFMNENTPMPGVRRRKDGTKQSMKEWAETNGFTWFNEKTLKLFLK